MANATNPQLANLLPNSTTKIPTSTYVPLSDPSANPDSGRAITKASFVGSLQLKTGEVDQVQSTVAGNSSTPKDTFWSLVKRYEGTPLASQLPPISAFASISASDLTAFGNGLVTVRENALESLQQLALATSNPPNSKANPESIGQATDLLNTALVQTNSFSNNVSTSQMGMLNLERLEMTPAGIQRGGLIATVPLAPMETTFVVQKEWSVTTQEFTSIITDSLDNYSETGVTENTQLTQATTSQIAHNNQSNVTASASGGVNFVFASGSASGSTSFTNQDQNSQSATNSRQNSVQTTRMASSRVKQSHKTTISTTSVVGTSDATTRKLVNPSATDAIRIDYFSMMRQWYVALYRYGMRLTYDITVPEPGAALREVYAQLDMLEKAASNQFVFPYKHSDITDATMSGDTQAYYLTLADKYGAIVPVALPRTGNTIFRSAVYPPTPTQFPVDIPVPDNCWITKLEMTAMLQYADPDTWLEVVGVDQVFQRSDFPAGSSTPNSAQSLVLDLTQAQYGNFMLHATGDQSFSVLWSHATEASLTLAASTELTPTAYATWQASVWQALYNAAQSQFYAQQQAINAQISALQNQINNVDTLTLRREESDEIMKCVLRWLLGPFIDFAFMTPAVVAAFKAAAISAAGGNKAKEAFSLKYGVNFTGDQTVITSQHWSILSGQEEKISFINEAIEWENVVFFTYSYFWDYPACWNFIRQIQHNDKTRQAFLRAGSARVVLTVRQGWEQRWAHFVNTGETILPAVGSADYLTIAKQVEAYDSTNYPGIPPANPNGGGLIDDDTPQFGTTATKNISPGHTNPLTTQVPIHVADTTGFVVGATAIIDTWDAGLDPTNPLSKGPGGQVGIGAQETQTITAVTPTAASSSTPAGTAVPGTITVQGLQYSHTGNFPVVQSGAKGLLIGEWFEYTPTSGTDIQVTVNPTGPYA